MLCVEDRILQKAYKRPCANPQNVEGNPKDVQSAIIRLHNEGLLRITHRGNNRGKIAVTSYEITDKGTEFVCNGGYAKAKRNERWRRRSKPIIAALLFIAGILTDIVLREWLWPLLRQILPM